MKYNKLVNILVFCVAMQPVVSFGSQGSQNLSVWQQYAPQRLQDLSSYVSQKTKDAYNAVNNWSTRKKILVASAIIGTLAALYNREQILQWVSDILKQQPEVLKQQPELTSSDSIWGGSSIKSEKLPETYEDFQDTLTQWAGVRSEYENRKALGEGPLTTKVMNDLAATEHDLFVRLGNVMNNLEKKGYSETKLNADFKNAKDEIVRNLVGAGVRVTAGDLWKSEERIKKEIAQE